MNEVQMIKKCAKDLKTFKEQTKNLINREIILRPYRDVWSFYFVRWI